MSGWQGITLGELCDAGGGEIRTGPFGSQLHEADYSEIGTPVVMPKDIATGRADDATIARVSDEHVERLSQHKLAVGDIVYGRRGDIGRKALVTEREAGWLCGTGCLRVTVGNKADSRFLFYRLGHPDTVVDIRNRAVGATMPNLNTTILRETPLTIPPLSIQRRIASILGAYDDLIEVNRRRIAVLEEMARGLFEEWFVRFRFPGHETVPILDTPDGPLPEGWSFEPLGILADIQWGDTSKTKKAYTPDGYRAYSASGPDGYMSYYDFDRTGVVLSAIGAKCGKTWLARGQWSCIKNTMRFWSRDGHVSTEYLFLALSDPEQWPRRGAAQPFISLGDARKIKLIRPDLPTSTRFDAMASSALELADNLRDQNERLAASRDLLLPRLISGQLSVIKAERQLEEVA